jgi:SET domain-containing protein
MKKELTFITPDHYVVKKSSAGLGLFAKLAIKKGQNIIEYIGNRMTEEEAQKRGGQYLFEVNSKVTIDGTPRWNTARYINHSCKPNCESKIIKNDRVIIRCIKDIAPGEELCYDYGPEFVKEHIKGNGKSCRCAHCLAKAEKKAAKNIAK